MVRRQSARVDQRDRPYIARRQRVVIGHDHRHAPRSGVGNFGPVGAAGVAGHHQGGSRRRQLVNPPLRQPVGFAQAVGNVVGEAIALRDQLSQAIPQHGGGGDPIGIKIPPDRHRLSLGNGLLEAVNGDRHVQSKGAGRGRVVSNRIQPARQIFSRTQLPLPQHLGQPAGRTQPR